MMVEKDPQVRKSRGVEDPPRSVDLVQCAFVSPVCFPSWHSHQWCSDSGDPRALPADFRVRVCGGVVTRSCRVVTE